MVLQVVAAVTYSRRCQLWFNPLVRKHSTHRTFAMLLEEHCAKDFSLSAHFGFPFPGADVIIVVAVFVAVLFRQPSFSLRIHSFLLFLVW